MPVEAAQGGGGLIQLLPGDVLQLDAGHGFEEQVGQAAAARVHGVQHLGALPGHLVIAVAEVLQLPCEAFQGLALGGDVLGGQSAGNWASMESATRSTPGWIWDTALSAPAESLRTSSATTAKPRPASPARAASMAAFRASRLVWAEIFRINATREVRDRLLDDLGNPQLVGLSGGDAPGCSSPGRDQFLVLLDAAVGKAEQTG